MNWVNSKKDQYAPKLLFQSSATKRMIIPEGNGWARVASRKIGVGCKFGAAGAFLSPLLIGLILISRAGTGELSPARENKSKFLINFAKFTEWPQSVFAGQKEPLLIDILGRDPFGEQLDNLAEKVQLAINLQFAKAAHLTLKSKLLRLSQIVEPPTK
jgi:hypothetical protein